MPNLLKLPLQLDEKTLEFRAIIETPKNSRNKYNYEENTGLFELGGVLPEGMVFPYDFGFAPSTLGEDGDPLDILLFMDAPAHVGCMVEARLIGVIELEQAEKKKKPLRNDRLLAVSVHSHSHLDMRNAKELGRPLLEEIEAFFASYNQQHGKRVKVIGIRGPSKALKLLKAGMRAFENA